ncbi:TPA: sel1 repeat family protein, partial [Klebsiella pneumoniae]|nr:sel1 repeat family protein [Klebsiella pneumoniae]HBX8221608.1 sel1 repeat family protein [Klebsiella pneumoniae]
MKGIKTWIVLGSLLLSGCDQKSAHKEASSEPLSDISAAMVFTCKHQ